MKQKTVMAWHFVGVMLRDGRPIPKDGEWLEHSGDLEMCQSGLHASIDVFDALQYAPGATLCRVECGGTIVKGNDKIVCSRRKIVKRIDATDLLRTFARKQALSVIHLWDIPAIVREYLETGDESKRAAARGAAWGATREAAWGAAWGAARDAARKQFNDMVIEAFKE